MPTARGRSQIAASTVESEVQVTSSRQTKPRGSQGTRRSPTETAQARKRKRSTPVQINSGAKVEAINLDSDDISADGAKKAPSEAVDLCTIDEAAESAQPSPPPIPKVRLRAYQCVICMDNATNLTVTHCGHLFCGDCLHTSLQMDSSRKICPICRQRIDMRLSATASLTSRTRQKSFYPLHLKLMTAKRIGKQTAK